MSPLEVKMCRTPEQIAKDELIVGELDQYIKDNGDHKNTLMMKVLRKNFISHEQNKDDHLEILTAIQKHFEDKEAHTPKGILVRTTVIAWAVFIMILVSTIVAYLPEKVAILLSP